MAVWSWANVASPVRSSTKARTHLSICPTDPLVGQVDRLAATVMQPFVEERVSSPSTASLPVANLAGFQNFDSPGNDATPTELLAPLFKPVFPPDDEPAYSEPCIARRGRPRAADGAAAAGEASAPTRCGGSLIGWLATIINGVSEVGSGTGR